jgi:hypothetical protein
MRRRAIGLSLAADGASAAGMAVVAALAVRWAIEPVASAVANRFVGHGAKWFVPYYGFLFVGLVAIAGGAAGCVLRRVWAREGRPWLAPLIVFVAAAVIGGMSAPWLGYAAPIAVVAFGALLFPTRAMPRTSSPIEPFVCVAVEAACAGAAFWFPLARDVPAMFVVFVALPAVVAVFAIVAIAPETRARLAIAGLPLLFLPWVGLRRNPTFVPLLVAFGLAVVIDRLARTPSRAVAVARANAIVLAMVAFAWLWVLPWAFRDMPTADQAGHESQHLGWINSMSFGKLMMADAGFTYGPLREYALAAIAWACGGITLDHVRLAHVVVNALGVLALVLAMHRVGRGRVHLLFIGTLLLLTHSPIASFLVYTKAYSFGWADELRAGLATLSIVVVFVERRAAIGGVLAALALLYSHDFGVPALGATLCGFVMERRLRGETWRTVALRARAYGVGLCAVIVPVVAVYAICGKLGAFVSGYQWTVRLFAGLPWAGEALRATFDDFASFHALIAPPHWENFIGARALESYVPAAIVVAGFVHVVVALARRRFGRPSIVIATLALFGGMTLRHAFMVDDVFHMLNAEVPVLVLFVALAAHARPLPIATIAAAILPLFWLAAGAAIPFDLRLASIAAGDERPSFGEPYRYDDLPRAGDERVTDQHLVPVRWVLANTTPKDGVLFAIWPISGGTEAFLSQRRNPTSFDKPDEIVTNDFRRRIASELARDPPSLVVGNIGNLGEDAAHDIETHYTEFRMGDLPAWKKR